MIAIAKSLNVQVALATVPPQRPNGLRNRAAVAAIIPSFNDRIRALAASEGVVLVDVYAGMKDNLNLIGMDDLHPTELGYSVIADIFYQAVVRAFEAPAHVGGPSVEPHASGPSAGDGNRPLLLEHPHSRPRDDDPARRVAEVLRGARRIPVRQARIPAAGHRLQRLSRQEAGGSRLRRGNRPGALRQRWCPCDRGRSLGNRRRSCEGQSRGQRTGRDDARRRRRRPAAPRVERRRVLRARRAAIRGRAPAHHRRSAARPRAGRPGHLHGLQPRVVADGAVEADEA